MLATQFLFHMNAYAPSRSSPLSERSANACPRRFASPLMSRSSDTKSNTPFSKRQIKQAPISRDREEVRDKRRDLFLKKVKTSRDDKNWEARGEQILRMDFIKEQKKWESEKARVAPSFYEFAEDDDVEDAPVISSQAEQSNQWSQLTQSTPVQSEYTAQMEAEAALRQEQEELDALLEMAEEQENYQPSHFGSDEEDYDTLFMDYLSPDGATQSNEPEQAVHDSDDMMDMS